MELSSLLYFQLLLLYLSLFGQVNGLVFSFGLPQLLVQLLLWCSWLSEVAFQE
jgi:hypothetical protein